MDYTLKDFISDELMSSMKQLTELKDFSSVRVSSASVQEMPFDDFVNKDEIIITTALGSMDNPDYYRELFSYADRSDASAVLICLRSDNPAEIPASSIDYADSCGLPVFLIPWSLRFADIIALVYKNVHKSESREYSDTQTMLFNLFFRLADLNAAAEYIETSLSIPVEIRSSGGRTIGRSHSVHSCSIEQYCTSRGSECISLPIELNRFTVGYFNYTSDSDNASNDIDLIRRYILLPVTLWFYQRTIEDMSVSKIKNDFVWSLAHGEYETLNELYRQSIYLKFDLKKPYTCLNMTIKKSEDSQPSDGNSDDFSLSTMKKSNEVLNLIISEAAMRKCAVMAAVSGFEFIIYLENRSSNAEKQAIDLLQSVTKQIQHNFPNSIAYWGISEIKRDTPDFVSLYNNASLALQYSLQTTTEPHYFLYKETKKHLIINALISNAEIKKQADEIFRKLLDYDQTSDIGLMGTLVEYIRCNYNISETARKLHIHRQSLLYRLGKIEDLTGMSLNSHDDLFILEAFSRMYVFY